MTRIIRVAMATTLAAAIAACGGGGGDGGNTGGGKTTPTLELSATTVTFTATQAGAALPDAQTIEVTNSGGGTLAMPTVGVTYGSGAGWLHHGITETAAGYTITLRPNTTALAAATYAATVNVTCAGATGSPRAVTVSWEVTANPNPVIAVEPAALAFVGQIGLADPATQTVDVSNVAGGTLDPLTVATSEAWLSASVSGNVVTVGASVGSLTDGSYAGTVTITSANAANSPVAYPVSFTVNQPTMQATPASLVFATSFGVSPAAKTFTVANTGTGTLVAPTVAASEAWIDATVSGSGPSYTVSVAVDATALSEGLHDATVTVTSAGASNSPLTVPVHVAVDQPALEVSPTTLSFTTSVGVNPAAKTLTMSNVGAGSLATPTVGDDAGWLSAGAVSGTGPFTVQMSVDVTGLAEGDYTASVTVTSAGAGGSPATIPVSLRVNQPTMGVSPTALSFSTVQGSSPAARTLTVTNTGSGTLATPSVSDDAGWLSAAVTGSNPTYTVTVTVNAAALAVGSHAATLTITSPGASNTLTVGVDLAVTSSGGIDTSTIASAYESIGTLWTQRYGECFKMSPAMIAAEGDGIPETAAALAAAKAAGRIDYVAADAQACADAVTDATCAVLEYDEFPECDGVLVGKVANGDTCYAYDECATGYCTGAVTETCPSTCAAFKAVGVECYDGEECGENECMWDPADSRPECTAVTPPGAEGEACSNTWPRCQMGLTCKWNETFTAETCQPRGGLGASCMGDQDCNVALGCDWADDPHTCKPRVGLGESCLDAVCGYGLYCSLGAGSKCAEYPVVGEDCSETTACWTGYCDLETFTCVAGSVPVGGTCDWTTKFCVDGAHCVADECLADPAPSCYWP
jgi:hypothetical protein